MIRCLRATVSALIMVLVLVPLGAIFWTMLVDRGPDGPARGTLVHAAITFSNPLTWDSLRNSFLVATTVTALAMALGIALARILDVRRFWGRPLLLALGWSSALVSPVLIAVGVRWLLRPNGPVLERFGADSVLAQLLEHWGGWVGWVWLGLAFGVPWLTWNLLEALRRVPLVWDDVARWSGNTRRQTWWALYWPLVRPRAARSASALFGILLLEPAGPWLFGLRRTLAFQIVESATDAAPGELPSASSLAFLGIVVALLGRVLIQWWGGLDFLDQRPKPEASALGERPRPLERPGWFRAGFDRLLLLFWAGWSLAPLAAVAWIALGEGGLRDLDGWKASIREVGAIVSAPAIRKLLIESAILGGLVAGLNVLLALGMAGTWPERFVSSLSRMVPPLAWGVGVLAVPLLLRDLLDQPSTERLRMIPGWFDPYRNPMPPLVWAVALVQLPWMVRGVHDARQRLRRVLFEVSITLGDSRWRTFRAVAWPLFGPPLISACALSAILAATSLTPALLLTPTDDARPAAVGILWLMSEPDGLRPAAILAGLLWLLNLAIAPVLLEFRREEPEQLPRL